MFKINPAPTFKAQIKITVPGQDEPGTINFTFRSRSKSALTAWRATADKMPDLELLTPVIESWSGVADDDGAPVAYSAEALAALLDNYPAAALDIYIAYLREQTASRVKN